MDQATLQKLAKAHATLISTYNGLTKQEQFTLASAIIQFLAQQGEGAATPAGAYTPPPDMPSPPKEKHMEPGHGAVLSPAGYKCVCKSCGIAAYELDRPIMSKNMGVDALVAAFKPLGNAPEFHRDMLNVLKDKYGNTWIDCPVCQAEKGLCIIGDVNAEKNETSGGRTV